MFPTEGFVKWTPKSAILFAMSLDYGRTYWKFDGIKRRREGERNHSFLIDLLAKKRKLLISINGIAIYLAQTNITENKIIFLKHIRCIHLFLIYLRKLINELLLYEVRSKNFRNYVQSVQHCFKHNLANNQLFLDSYHYCKSIFVHLAILRKVSASAV